MFSIILRATRLFNNRTRLVVQLIIVLAIAVFCSPKADAQSAPSIDPASGSYTQPISVSLTGSGTMYYTTDGSEPTTASTEYTAPFMVSEPTQVNAVVYSGGSYSPVTTEFLDVDPGLLPIVQYGLDLRLTSGFGVIYTGSLPVISQWYDLSGQSELASGTSPNQPSYMYPWLTNPVASFNGSSDFLTLTGSPWSFNSDTEIFAVVQPSALTPGAHIFDFGQGSSGNNVLMQISSSGSYAQYWVYSGTSGTYAQSASPLTANQNVLLESVQSGTSATFYVNGVPGATNSSMNSIPFLTRSNSYIGQASSGGSFYPGNIQELLIYRSSLTNSQRVAIEAFLMQKYQIPSTVPAAPVISVPSGTLSKPTQVLISSDPCTLTYITLDGSTPTPGTSQVYYGGPITISFSQTLKAISYKSGISSSVSSATYTLDSGLYPAPSGTDPASLNINLQLPAPSI